MIARRALSIACCALATGVVVFAKTARAQVPDLVEIGAQYMPGAALEDPKPVEAQVASYDAIVNLPLPLGESTFVIPGISYHVDAISFAGAPPTFTQLRAFHSVEMPVLGVQLLPRGWALSLRLAPGLAGDFRRVDADHFRLSAVALATKSFSDTFVLGGGGVATYAFGSFLPLPALYTEWQPVEGLQIEAFIPAFAAVKRSFANRVELGVRAEIAGNAYAVRDARVADAWPCAPGSTDDLATSLDERAARPQQCLDHVAYSVGTAGVVAGVRLFTSVWLTTLVGVSFFRRLEQLNDRDDPVDGGLQSLPNVFVFRTGLTWRIPHD